MRGFGATVFGLGLVFAAQTATAERALVVMGAMLPPTAIEKLAGHLGKAIGDTVKPADASADGKRLQVQAGSADSLSPAGLIALAPMVLVARPALPAMDSAALIAMLRKDGASIRAAHAGKGSSSEHCLELLQQQLAVAFIAVASTPIAALQSGQADIACLEAPLAVPLAQSGVVTAHVVAAEERLQALWDVTSATEVGLPLFTATTWLGLYTADKAAEAPAHAGLQTFLADEAAVQALADGGLTPVPLTHRTIDAHQAIVTKN